MRNVSDLPRPLKFLVECNRCKHRFYIERNKSDDWWNDKIEALKEGKKNIYTLAYCDKCKDDKLVKFISLKEDKKPFVFREAM